MAEFGIDTFGFVETLLQKYDVPWNVVRKLIDKHIKLSFRYASDIPSPNMQRSGLPPARKRILAQI